MKNRNIIKNNEIKTTEKTYHDKTIYMYDALKLVIVEYSIYRMYDLILKLRI